MRNLLTSFKISQTGLSLLCAYFQRSSSWFYHKLDGIDGNGGEGGFTPEEAEQMRGALIDLSDRIRRAAESIPSEAMVEALSVAV